VRLITDEDGDTVSTSTFDEFGNRVDHTGTADSAFGYTGAWTDPATGLVHHSLELARDTYAANPNAERKLAVRGTEFMKRAYPTLSEFFDQPRGQGKAAPAE